jgi:cellulose biosynthesis protein BcsQ
MINRTVAIAQGKGGVGKTSLTTNIGGLTAASGLRVLIVDLDQQGNVARDLGLEPDDGAELFEALTSAKRGLHVTHEVRPNLDVVLGGPAMGDAASAFASREQRGAGTLAEALESKLAQLAPNYDLILLDTPPGDRIVTEAALVASAAVVIPTRADQASIDGVARIAERFLAVRDRNPHLRLAGVALFAMATRAGRLERDLRATLAEILGSAAPVFATRIRDLHSAAADARVRGKLVHELEQAGRDERAARIAALKAGETPSSGLYARDATGLASDYENLAHELLVRIAEIEQEVSVPA